MRVERRIFCLMSLVITSAACSDQVVVRETEASCGNGSIVWH